MIVIHALLVAELITLVQDKRLFILYSMACLVEGQAPVWNLVGHACCAYLPTTGW